jgi:hypothetical protein
MRSIQFELYNRYAMNGNISVKPLTLNTMYRSDPDQKKYNTCQWESGPKAVDF